MNTQSSIVKWAVILILALLSVSYISVVIAGSDIWTTNGPFVSAVYDLAIDPQNPGTLYAAIFHQNAIFKSSDYGSSWHRLDGDYEENFIHSVAVDSHSASVLYAVGGHTVYKSTDGGVNWFPVLQLLGGIGNSFGDRHDVLVSKRDSNIVIVVGEAGIYLSDDAGGSWDHVWTSPLLGGGVSRRLFIGARPNMLWVIPFSGMVLQSNDEGQTWQELHWPSAAMSMAFDPTNENVIYLGTTGLGMLKSLDGGDTWQVMYTGNLPTVGIINDIVFHPTNPDIIFVAYSGDTGAGIYRSLDHGQTWVQMNDGMGIRSVWRLAADHSNPLHLYAGTSVGVYEYTVTTLQPADYSITINNGTVYCSSEAVTLSLTAPPNTTEMQISNDGGFPNAQWEPFAPQRSWTLSGHGNSIVTRVAYARFRGLDGTITSTYMDDIILDTSPPTGTVDITGTMASFAAIDASHAKAVTQSLTDTVTNTLYLPMAMNNVRDGFTLLKLALWAQDDLSGVGEMLIDYDTSFADSQWEVYVAEKDWWIPEHIAPIVYVRFRDRAGNESETFSATDSR